MRLPIIHQDSDLVVVDKPVAVPTHATDDDVISTDVVGITRAQLGLDYLAVHHRLDKETSGVLAFAASKEANASLAQAFAGRTAAKSYLAIVAGRPTRPHGSINAPIGKLASGVYAVGREVPTDLAQPASTRFRVEEEGPKGRYSLLSLVPETGRTHQIRLHLAYAGTPIMGDTLYNSDGRFAPRLLLHADRLELPHPSSGQQLILRSRPPAIFGRILTGLPELTFVERLIDPQSDKRQLAHICQALLHSAQERRVPLVLDPDTTAYRLLNGAGDGIPGLTLDVFGGVSNSGNGQAEPVVGVASFYADDVAAAWSDDGQPGGAMTNSHARQTLRELLPGLRAALNLTTLYLKVRPPRADALSDVERETAAPLAPLGGPPIDEIVVRENGLAYLIRPAAGLSVGLFLDMRDLRARVRHWSADQNVLNLFAYTCGFGVAATAGGARRVLNIDLSRRALDWGMAAYAANGFAADRYDFVDGDVFDWLGRLARRKETFGLVIVDPPGFSRSSGPGRGKTTSFSAARDYDHLAAQSAAVVSPGGRLVMACNQARISRRTFRDAVMAGIATTGRRATIAGIYHEPDLDFPTSGGDPYLKILVLTLE